MDEIRMDGTATVLPVVSDRTKIGAIYLLLGINIILVVVFD